ncbi:MAG: prepilin-type N-terminal cleavage/methylation domain-containing protein [Acidobacteria bacterium]|nr:prepilin-type N-terminal cleavage/methylation domain-containing protein [Acidobacteriota bacterium]MBK8150101.1 prepilin-type N-terminal cleavage/methylation domain-containing protein [Acidobacteriota bacterium]MBK8811062.1 prepilin-type N-terminal cleavage/methylation domain-containing protein [Acidobacteriota bacterium]
MSRGFSLVELMIVMVTILILSGFSVFYLSGHQRLFRPDEQSLRIVDALQEARQRSLTQRETMRVEIDVTDGLVRLIDENSPTTADDDIVIRSTELFSASDVRLGLRPSDISTNPEESLPVPAADFRPSLHPGSLTHYVCTLRFLRNGSVSNQGSDAIGTNSTATGSTIFIWSPKKDAPNESDIARAITIVGATGSVRYWEYDRALASTNKWKDTRRSGAYGGGQTGN